MKKVDRLLESKPFVELLQKQIKRKAELYDGIHASRPIYEWLAFLSEETGEVASELIRDRLESAQAECVDVAHTAMLLWMELERQK